MANRIAANMPVRKRRTCNNENQFPKRNVKLNELSVLWCRHMAGKKIVMWQNSAERSSATFTAHSLWATVWAQHAHVSMCVSSLAMLIFSVSPQSTWSLPHAHESDGINLTPNLGFTSLGNLEPSLQIWPVTRPSVLLIAAVSRLWLQKNGNGTGKARPARPLSLSNKRVSWTDATLFKAYAMIAHHVSSCFSPHVL